MVPHRALTRACIWCLNIICICICIDDICMLILQQMHADYSLLVLLLLLSAVDALLLLLLEPAALLLLLLLLPGAVLLYCQKQQLWM